MIRVNDRQDPNQPSVPVPGAEIVDTTGSTRRFLAPVDCELVARLSNAVVQSRFNVAIGEPEAPEGTAPAIWYGVVESWQPSGAKVLVTCREARTVEEGIHTSGDSPILHVPASPFG